MNGLRIAAAVAAHDLGAELRRPVASGAMLVFGASSLVVLRLALAGGGAPSGQVLAGALWVVLVFAALLGTSRSWSTERENGTLDALLSAAAPRWAVHLGKLLGAYALTLLLHAVLLGAYVVVFRGPGGAHDVLLLVATVALADAGFAAVGVLVGALGMRARSRDLLGPVLMLPLVVPLVIAAVTATLAAYDVAGAPSGQLLGFLLLYDATFLAAGCVAFPELAVE